MAEKDTSRGKPEDGDNKENPPSASAICSGPDTDSASHPEQKSPQNSPRGKLPRQENTSSADGSSPSSPRYNMVAASPPKFVSFDEIMKAANGVQNMTLAHELAVDKDFRFKKVELPANSLEKQVQEVVHQVFWDSLEEQLNEDPPDLSQALSLLSEVKQILGELILPNQQRLKAVIDESIDLDLVKQQAENNTLDFMAYADSVISFMAKMCAPARDDEVSALRSITGIVPLYREMMKVLDDMKMDMANFTIQQMRPFLQQQSVSYERTKFDQFLEQQQENGVDGLAATRSWLKRTTIKLSELPGALSGSSTVSPWAILNAAYMELFDWPENLVYPETLLMDQQRFCDLSEKVQWLTLVASLLLITFNSVGASIAGMADLKTKLKQDLTSILEGVPSKEYSDIKQNAADQVIKDVATSLKDHGFPEMSEGSVKLLRGQVEGVFSDSHPVHKLIQSRLMTFIESIMQRQASPSMQLPPGFSALSDELNHVCGQFMRLTSYNRSVFGQHYAKIMEASIKEQKDSEMDH